MKRRKTPAFSGQKAFLDNLTASPRSRPLDDHDEILACPRCNRLTPARDLRLWKERLRLRTFADGGFKYIHKDRYFAVCPDCLQRLSSGGGMTDFHERRGIALLAGAILLAVVAAGLTPYVLPTVASAFWQTR